MKFKVQLTSEGYHCATARVLKISGGNSISPEVGDLLSRDTIFTIVANGHKVLILPHEEA